MKINTGDMVKVMRGSFKGEQAKVLSVDTAKGLVMLEGIKPHTKHKKPDMQNREGGRVEVGRSIPVSSVCLVDPSDSKKVTKIGYKIVKDKKIRIAKSSGKEIK